MFGCQCKRAKPQATPVKSSAVVVPHNAEKLLTYAVTEWRDSTVTLVPVEKQTSSYKVDNQLRTSTNTSPEPAHGSLWSNWGNSGLTLAGVAS